jgi:hypothetical protein
MWGPGGSLAELPSPAVVLAVTRAAGFLEPEAARARRREEAAAGAGAAAHAAASPSGPRGLARRVIACLDVRSNDAGDLVVTKARAGGRGGGKG